MGERPVRGESSQRGVEGVEVVRGGGDGAGGGPLQAVLVSESRAGSVVMYELVVRQYGEGGV